MHNEADNMETNTLNILSDAAKEYVTFSGKQPDTPGSVKFVYETAAIEAD